MDEQIKKLERGVDVLIATPGRMIDLYERGNILLHDIKIFVIDEADRMLDMGFIPDIEKIAGLIPKIRQTLFFSATMPVEIRKLAEKFLMNPREISVAAPATTAATVEQAILRVGDRQKRQALRNLLKQQDLKNAFIFCNRKRDVAILTESLQRHGFKADCLHGDMHQTKRNEALERFKAGTTSLLVCSDVAARGLDIKGVDAVFNFDVPFQADDYVHRIGRTGRAGMNGKAFTLVTPDEEKLLQTIISLIQKDIKEIKLAVVAASISEVTQITDLNATITDDKVIGSGDNSHLRPTRTMRPQGDRQARGTRNRNDRDRNDKNARDRSPRNPERGQEHNQHRPRDERGPRPPSSQGYVPRPSYDRDALTSPLPQVVGFGDELPAFLRTTRARPASVAVKEKAE
jgi:superfamily II DNA/RNA helicase